MVEPNKSQVRAEAQGYLRMKQDWRAEGRGSGQAGSSGIPEAQWHDEDKSAFEVIVQMAQR
jgi:hypothetical protein